MKNEKWTLSLRVAQVAAWLALLIFHFSFFIPPPSSARPAQSTHRYDLLLRGGHVIDPRNGISALRDVAIRSGVIAAVAPRIIPSEAAQTVDVTGLYVTPGLVDIHVHVYAGTGEAHSYAGDNSVYPDGFTFRAGVTTVVDAGSSGWRNFDDFRSRDPARASSRFSTSSATGCGAAPSSRTSATWRCNRP
jgi:hypothetical protein